MNLATERFDDAVSPVVAVILMVAVTVILAAVIGTFVLDLGNNVNANPQAGVTIDQSASDAYDSDADGENDSTGYEVSVDLISMDNADSLRVEYNDAGDSEEVWNDDEDTATDPAEYAPEESEKTLGSVGNSVSFDHLAPGDQITVIGELDGKETVLQTHTVEE